MAKPTRDLDAKTVNRIRHVVNLTGLCRVARLDYQRIVARLRRGSGLEAPAEANGKATIGGRMAESLEKAGVYVRMEGETKAQFLERLAAGVRPPKPVPTEDQEPSGAVG